MQISSAGGLTGFHVQEHIYKESSCLAEGKARLQDKAGELPGRKLALPGSGKV